MFEITSCFILAFAGSYLVMPSIIRIGLLKGLVDVPDERKSHSVIVPSFGGIGIFSGVLLALLLICPTEYFSQLKYIFASLIVVFIVGAIDDLNPISPISKLIGQLGAVCVLVFLADIRIGSLYGFCGIEQLPYWISIVLSVVIFIYVINSFNLIDGINGLSSSIAILLSSIIGSWFVLNGFYQYGLISFALCGALLAFLRYNITPAKIFMGDTGSLVIGTLCTILIIQFLEANSSLSGSTYAFNQGLSFALSLIILPVFDTLRVFIYRIYKGKSPFSPDKNHIHHLLLDLGMTHMQATGSLLLINVGFILFALQMQQQSSLLFFFLCFCLATLLTSILSLSINVRRRRIAQF